MYNASNISISVIGLGYVGLPLAVALSNNFNVVGYDIDSIRTKDLNNSIDKTKEVSKNQLRKSLSGKLLITSSFKLIKKSKVIIITLPTPIYKNKKPNLSFLKNITSKISKLDKSIKRLVIYESTVYPGLLREKLLPIFLKHNLKLNYDFYIGYSPERINPGDRNKTLSNVIKIISASNKQSLNLMYFIYSKIVKAGIYKAESIEIAEAAKVIENTQRDVNIALINEFSKIFNKMNIDTNLVLKAAKTKWNFIDFKPGLVGGHCIGVDPYYLAYKSKKKGYNPKLILSGRSINDSMPKFIFESSLKELKKKNITKKNINALILGATFKENCPDTRNSKVFDLINLFISKKIKFSVYDPLIQNIDDYYFADLNEIYKKKYNLIIIAVAHKKFKKICPSLFNKTFIKNGVIFDLKNLFPKNKNYIKL